MRKSVVYSVIFILVSVSVAPTIYADESREQQVNTTVNSKDEKLISLPVREYKPDGTIRRYFVELTQSQYDEMTGRLQIAEDLDERLSIYKDYKVVPEDVTSESLRRGMEEKARRFGLDKKIDKMVHEKENLPSIFEALDIHYNYNCSVGLLFPWSIFPAIGLSPLTGRIHMIILLFYVLFKDSFEIPFQIPSIDIITLCIGVFGTVGAKNGTMPDFMLGTGGYMLSFHGCVLLVGFVGYAVGGFFGPLRPCDFYGFASFICTFGNE